jgi:hypothetical protein
VILLALAACTRESDAALNLEAAKAEPDAAVAICRRIRDDGAQGDCLMATAGRIAASGRFKSATALCETIETAVFHDECWFLAADEAGALGAEAVDACRHAGQYRENCLGHAIGREVPRVEARFANAGQERALQDAVREIVARYKPAAPEDQREVTVDRMVGQILSKRWEGQPFDAARCGEVTASVCRLAYRMNLDGAPPAVPIEQICRDGVTLDRVTAAQAPAWTPGSDETALAVWRELCEDLRSGRVQRDAQHSMGVPPMNAPPPDPGHLPGEDQPKR